MTPPQHKPTFIGAALPVCGVDVLIVVVKPWILGDEHEAHLYAVAFHLRFHRTIVLAAQDDAGVPTYWGPPTIVRALCGLPFEIIPWQCMPYRMARPERRWQLPIPADPPPTEGSGASSLGDSAIESIEMCSRDAAEPRADDHAPTRIFDRGVQERMARTTAR